MQSLAVIKGVNTPVEPLGVLASSTGKAGNGCESRPGVHQTARTLKVRTRALASCSSRSSRSTYAFRPESRSEVPRWQHLARGPSCYFASCSDRHPLRNVSMARITQSSQGLTRFLQEQSTACKDAALAPAHSVAEIVQSNFLRPLCPRQTGLRNSCFAIECGNWHSRPTPQREARVALVVWLIAEYLAASRTCRRRCHLHGKIATGKH